MVGLKLDEMSQLFKFRPVVIGAPLRFNGAILNFFYTLHSIPCIGFTVDYQDKSIYFSADTFYDPEGIQKIHEKGFMTKQRLESLQQNIWNHDRITKYYFSWSSTSKTHEYLKYFGCVMFDRIVRKDEPEKRERFVGISSGKDFHK